MSDVGMLHHGQGLALTLETRDRSWRSHSRLNEFEGNSPPNGPFLLGEVHNTHPALAEDAQETIIPNAVSYTWAVGFA
jgi:hypothetical protein